KGFNGPIPIVVDVNGDSQAPQKIYDRVQGLPGVASVRKPQFNEEKTVGVGAREQSSARAGGPSGGPAGRKPQFNEEKTVGIVFVTPTSAPQDEKTDELVNHLRDDVVPSATEGGDAVAYVSGQTAAFKDIADRIMERLPLFLLYIIGVTFIVLAMAFRDLK